jgi:hypothetical protein
VKEAAVLIEAQTGATVFKTYGAWADEPQYNFTKVSACELNPFAIQFDQLPSKNKCACDLYAFELMTVRRKKNLCLAVVYSKTIDT